MFYLKFLLLFRLHLMKQSNKKSERKKQQQLEAISQKKCEKIF